MGMRRQMKVREEFRKADSSDRLKRLMKERIYQYKDAVYEPGVKVYIQDRISGRWDGPAIVKIHQGNEVKVTFERSELSVSFTLIVSLQVNKSVDYRLQTWREMFEVLVKVVFNC